MKDFLFETKQIDLLVGTIKNETIIKNGLLFKYYPEQYINNMLQNTAILFEQNGSIMESIQLFILCGSYENVVDIFLTHLSRMISLSIHTPERQQFIEMSIQFTNLMVHTTNTMNEMKLNTLNMLLKLIQYFDLYHLGIDKYEDALEILNTLHLIPLNETNQELDFVLQRFNLFDISLRRMFAEIAVTCMEIYYVQYSSLKRSLNMSQRDRGQQHAQILKEIRSKARALVNFIGMNQMYIGADVNAKLVRLEALMS
jgi:hypothetical protein